MYNKHRIENSDPVGVLVSGNDMDVIQIDEIPEFINNTRIFDVENVKRIKKFETGIRSSRGYYRLFQYLKKNYGMVVDGFNPNLATGLGDMRIELHHTPFTLFDITQIVCNKHIMTQGFGDEFTVGEEVVLLHWQNLVGLYPLSPTHHELVHSGCMDIHPKVVRGNWRDFIRMYKPFFPPNLLDRISELEKWERVACDRIPDILQPRYTFLQYDGIPMYKTLAIEDMRNVYDELT
jgi:hypothetical protein